MAGKKQPIRLPSVERLMREIKTPDGFRRSIDTVTYGYAKNSPKMPVLKLETDDVRIEIVFTPQRSPHRRDGYDLGSGHVSFDSSDGWRSFDRTGVEDSFYIDNPAKWDTTDRFWSGDRVVLAESKHLGTLTTTPGYRLFGENRTDSWEDLYVIAWDSGVEVSYNTKQFKKAGISRADIFEQTNEKIRKFVEVKIPEARARIDRSESVPGIPFTVTPERKQSVINDLLRHGRATFMPSGFGIGYVLETKKTDWNRKAEKATEDFFGVKPLFVDTFDAD